MNLVPIETLFLWNARLYLDSPLQHLLLTSGGRLGLKSERDGYPLLRGWQNILACIATWAALKREGKGMPLLQVLDAL